jgi:hypothetical protein
MILIRAILDLPLGTCTDGTQPGSPAAVLHQLALGLGRANLNLIVPVAVTRQVAACAQFCLVPLSNRVSCSPSRTVVSYQTVLAGMNFALSLTGQFTSVHALVVDSKLA